MPAVANSPSTLALTNQWLDYDTKDDGLRVQSSNCVSVYPWSGWTYPVYVTSPARPVKLTLSEIEKLRAVAKKDAKVKAILQKFTGLIEIEVDF